MEDILKKAMNQKKPTGIRQPSEMETILGPKARINNKYRSEEQTSPPLSKSGKK